MSGFFFNVFFYKLNSLYSKWDCKLYNAFPCLTFLRADCFQSVYFFLRVRSYPVYTFSTKCLALYSRHEHFKKKNRTDGANTLMCSYNNNNIRHKTLDVTLSSRQVFFNLIAESFVCHIIVVNM